MSIITKNCKDNIQVKVISYNGACHIPLKSINLIEVYMTP